MPSTTTLDCSVVAPRKSHYRVVELIEVALDGRVGRAVVHFWFPLFFVKAAANMGYLSCRVELYSTWHLFRQLSDQAIFTRNKKRATYEKLRVLTAKVPRQASG